MYRPAGISGGDEDASNPRRWWHAKPLACAPFGILTSVETTDWNLLAGAATGDSPRGQEYCLAINFLNFFDLPGPHPGVEVGSQEWPTAEA